MTLRPICAALVAGLRLEATQLLEKLGLESLRRTVYEPTALTTRIVETDRNWHEIRERIIFQGRVRRECGE